MGYFWSYIGVGGVASAAVVALYALFPEHRYAFNHEAGAVETLTALLFAAAFSLSLVAYARGRRAGDAGYGLVLVPGFLALAALIDETSFFRPLFHWDVPVVLGVGLDAPHDALDLSIAAIRAVGQSTAAVVVLLLLLALAGCVAVVVAIYRRRLAELWRSLGSAPRLLIGFACAWVILALAIDAGGWRLYPAHAGATEEWAECLSALALLFCVPAVSRQAGLRGPAGERDPAIALEHDHLPTEPLFPRRPGLR